jgi:hypothetical protein
VILEVANLVSYRKQSQINQELHNQHLEYRQVQKLYKIQMVQLQMLQYGILVEN